MGAHLVAVHHDFDPKRFIAASAGTERGYGEYLTRQIDRPGMVLLVADEAGAVLGYAYAGLEGADYMALRGPAGVVYDLVVDPARRRQGIGPPSVGRRRRGASGARRAARRAVHRGSQRGGPGPVRERRLSSHDDRNDLGPARRGLIAASYGIVETV